MWFITVFEKCEFDDLGWPDYGSETTWGYYADQNKAVQALHGNWTDMWETCYNYAVLEKIGEGLIPDVEYIQLFKFDRERNGYFEIEAPKGHDRFGPFAIK